MSLSRDTLFIIKAPFEDAALEGTWFCTSCATMEGALLANLKRDFAQVKHLKPAASRSDSAELYVLATGFRGDRRAGDAPHETDDEA